MNISTPRGVEGLLDATSHSHSLPRARGHNRARKNTNCPGAGRQSLGRLRSKEAYPALLTKKAESAGSNLIVLNAGVSGDTTSGGLRRLPHLLGHRIDALVLELGINDVFRGVPVAQIEANLQAMIDLLRKRYPQVQIVIAGMQLPLGGGENYLAQFGAIFPRLAARNDAALIPFLLQGVAGNPALNQNDMIHPNARGQKILAANVWPVLQRALRNRAVAQPRS